MGVNYGIVVEVLAQAVLYGTPILFAALGEMIPVFCFDRFGQSDHFSSIARQFIDQFGQHPPAHREFKLANVLAPKFQ